MKKLLIISTIIFALSTSLCNEVNASPRQEKTTENTTISSEQFKKLEGNYQLAPGFVISVFQENGKFMTQATGQPSFEIFADSHTTFHATVADIKISFTIGTDGKATHFNLIQNGRAAPPAARVQ